MLTIQKKNADRIDIEFSGPLDATMMAAGLDDLIEASEGMTGGKMLYRIPDFTMPTFGALMVEMTRLPQLFGLLGKFDKCAVLTDAQWLKTASRVEGAMIPSLQIAAFDLDELEAAEAWLGSDTDEAENVPFRCAASSGLYRTFRVARPMTARISEMIQNRITICGSAQPFFS